MLHHPSCSRQTAVHWVSSGHSLTKTSSLIISSVIVSLYAITNICMDKKSPAVIVQLVSSTLTCYGFNNFSLWCRVLYIKIFYCSHNSYTITRLEVFRYFCMLTALFYDQKFKTVTLGIKYILSTLRVYNTFITKGLIHIGFWNCIILS